jgi:UDP-glucose 4-epimerase
MRGTEAREGAVDSTSNLLEIIGRLKERSDYRPRRFVYASSSMVYGNFTTDEATEESPTRPINIYGTMKLAGEAVTRGLGACYGIPTTIIRPSAVYGPTDMNGRVSQIFIDKAFRGEHIEIHGADEALDFAFVKDTAQGFVRFATQDGGIDETFNVTYGKAHRLVEFVECLRESFESLEYDVIERDDGRPKRGTLSIEKARRLVGYEPQYPLERGIAEYVDFVRRYRDPSRQ